MAKALLVLEDGTVVHAVTRSARPCASHGEVVFCTAMTGYQEALTDPSFAEQMLVMTYPLQGNYGINEYDVESRRIQVRAFVVREDCAAPSHWRSKRTLHAYLEENGVPGIAGVDTRALTRKLRTGGVMMGTVTHDETAEQALGAPARPAALRLDGPRAVGQHARSPYEYPPDGARPSARASSSSISASSTTSCASCTASVARPIAVPCHTTAEDILAMKPDGVLLSPGPGDPALLDYAVDDGGAGSSARCRSWGSASGTRCSARCSARSSFKLKFGHRGANHPVRDEATGRVYITAQNHGYAVDDARARRRTSMSATETSTTARSRGCGTRASR